MARRKFALSSEISAALARFKQTEEGPWHFVPSKKIVKQLLDQITAKNIYVNGKEVPQYPLLRKEALLYLRSLPIPQCKELPTGKRISQIPVFYSPFQPSIQLKSYNGKANFFGFQTDKSRVLVDRYEKEEKFHKDREAHHPDGFGWSSTFNNTVECVFDVYNSLLRKFSVRTAYGKLLVILSEEKFEKLDPNGIIQACLHFIVRGVAASDLLRQSSSWREVDATEADLVNITLRYMKGIPPESVVAAYRAELTLHSSHIRMELCRMRITRTGTEFHDHSKFKPSSVYFYSWYWGIFQRMSNVYRQYVLRNQLCEDIPTMFASYGQKFMEGALQTPEFNDVLAITRQLPEEIGTKVDQATEKAAQRFEQIAKEREESLVDKAQELIGTLKETGNSLADEVLSKTIGKSKEIGDALAGSFEPAFEVLNSIRTMIDSVVSQVSAFLSTVPGMKGITITPMTLFDALKYYIMYINTSSSSLKIILLFLILNSLGVTRILFSEILKYWSWASGMAQMDGVTVDATPTSLLEWASEAPQNLMTVIGSAIAFLAKGASLSFGEFTSLSKKLADSMRNFHFIGAGITGIIKIFDYFKKFWTIISEWVMENLFGRTSDAVILAREVTKFLYKLAYFNTEAGLSAIRMSENVRKQAEEIYPKWTALMAEARSKPEYRNHFIDLERRSRAVKDLSDFLTRFRAVSNFQPTMFHIQLVGRPGIGKSTITKNIVSDLSKTLWPDEPTPSFYSINNSLDHFDGYAGQRIMIADDVYKINEPLHLTMTMGLVTNTPVILPMANLADKGVQLTSEVLISSTNTAYPLGKDVLCMEAVHRRRHMLVDVTCDERVIDKALGQFSKALFDKYYPNQRVSELPHLKFGLLKPVPLEFGGACIEEGEDQFNVFKDYAKKLKCANIKISTATGELEPDFYFSEDNTPPGIKFPATGWDYKQFISNCVVRYSTFRGMESSYNQQRKYAHVERCLAEIDSIFDQNADIPEGTTFPTKMKFLEQFSLDLTHPYGSTDPVGERIVNGDNIAPELDNVDFEELVDQILAENTPTSLDLEEERRRTRNILNRRNRQQRDPALQHALRLSEIDNKFYVELSDHCTSWDRVPEFPLDASMTATYETFRQQLFETGYDIDDLPTLREERSGWKKSMLFLYYGLKEQYLYMNEGFKMLYSVDMPFPAGFGDRTGNSTGMPIAFLKQLVKIDGRWYLDVSHLNIPQFDRKVSVSKDSKTYEIPLDIAFLLSQSSRFRVFVSEFNSLTLEQQDLLIKEAKWRSNYSGSYTFKKIAEDMTSSFKAYACKSLHYLCSPFRVLLERYPYIATLSAVMLAYLAIIWTLRKIGDLFSPQPTSKVLHRGPQSQIVYRGIPTASTQFTSIVEPVLKRNVKRIRIFCKTYSATVQALCVEQFMLLNKHVVNSYLSNDFSIEVYNPEGTSTVYELSLDQNTYQHPAADLMIIHSRMFPAARKIDHHFVSDSEYSELEVASAPLTFLGHLESSPLIENFQGLGKKENMVLRNTYCDQTNARMLIADGVTTVGRSGSTVVISSQGRTRIVGLQAWAIDRLMSPKIAIQVITQELFKELKEKVLALSPDNYIERTYEPELEDMEPTAAFADLPERALVCSDEHVVGDVGRNLIKPSIISSQMAKRGIVSSRIPACMSDRDKRLYHHGEVHPLAHSIGKYYRGSINPINKNILSRAVHSLSHFLQNKLDTNNFEPLSIQETITGTREDGSNPMNLNSSPGIPFIFERRNRKGKRDYMEIDEEGEVSHLDEQFVSDYLVFESSLMNGKVPYTRAYDFPKDELRPIPKVLGTETTPPKTRSVTCMNVFYVLAWRRYTLRLWSAMHRAADGTIPFCPGINPEGPEWNNLYHYLNRHPNAVDFDVSNWDGFYFSQLFYAALDVIKNVMRLKRQSSISILLDSIFYDVMNCYIQYLNIIYQKERGLVSGFPGTAEVNTLGHWLLAICIYFKLVANTIFNTFQAMLENTSIAIYGDDIVYTFSDNIRDLINGHTLKLGYEEIGYPVTSASKTTEVDFSKPLMSCTFLKSTWRELVPAYFIRKMDMDIAYDLVLWVRAKQHPQTQFYENYIDALHIAFGNGEEVFYSFQAEVNSALRSIGKDNIYYSYYDFEQDYFQRYFADY